MSLETYLRDLVRQAVREELADRDARTEPAQRPEFLTLAQAANETGISKSTFRGWVKAGKLPTWGAGRVVRVRRDEFLMLLERGHLGDDLPSVSEQADTIIARLTRNAANGSRS